MATYKTPGVYVEEVSTLPPSVAEVATAIPAFIGFTEISGPTGQPLVKRITSILEFTNHFGGPAKLSFKVIAGESGIDLPTDLGEKSDFILYYAMKHYFDNGGGPCYIVSVGNFEDVSDMTASDIIGLYKGDPGKSIEGGFEALRKLDEPTLLLFPDLAINRKINDSNYADICNTALSQCADLKDRFTIMDVRGGRLESGAFRQHVRSETSFLKYGAAYTPFLRTLMTYSFDGERESLISVDDQRSPLEVQEIFNFERVIEGTNPSNFLRISFISEDREALPNFEVIRRGNSGVQPKGSANFKINIDTDSQPINQAFIKELNDLANDLKGKFDFELGLQDLSISLLPSTTLNPLQDNDTIFEAKISQEQGITDLLKAVCTMTASGNTVTPQIEVKIDESELSENEGLKFVVKDSTDSTDEPSETGVGDKLTIIIRDNSNPLDPSQVPVEIVMQEWEQYKEEKPDSNWNLEIVREDFSFTTRQSDSLELIEEANVSSISDGVTLDRLNSNKQEDEDLKDTALYGQIKQALSQLTLTLPPSPAMAGIYARVDRTSGVWKAPANVSILGISGPNYVITNEEQDDLNVDAISGKSINAIRAFTGKGTLVWGARTLAGNDNEWRYVSVRRLFNLIEESVQKSTSFAVFEPNTTTTWLKVKAMIDSYLYGLWQQGALAGSVPEQAYFVQVGLGKTMTPQDILEGRMIVEIGIAAVRPAEFIILKFSHKLQEA